MKDVLWVFLTVWVMTCRAGADPVAPAWPIWRGDRALTGVASGVLSTNLSMVWSFKAGDVVRSSPVVGYGYVFFGSQDGKVYALDEKDGKEVWSFAAGAGVDAPPLLHEGMLFVGDMDGIFHALDVQEGKERWRFETGAQIPGSANWLSAMSNDRIVVGSHDFSVYALAAGSGRKAWSHESQSFINGSPAVYDNRVVVGGCDEKVHILSGEDGSGVAVEAGSYIAGSGAVSAGRVFIGHYGDLLICIDIEEKRIVWEFGNQENGGPFFASPAVDDTHVVAGCRDRRIYCVDKLTGRELWQFATGDRVDSSPVICDGKVVAGSDDGVLYMLDLGSGRRLWSFDVGRPIGTAPAVVRGKIIVGADDGRVYLFGRKAHAGEAGTSVK